MGTSPSTVFASSMKVRPIPGWRLNTHDLGLPTGATFVDRDVMTPSYPLIGYLRRNGYFLAQSTAGPTEWWLVGVDTGSGRSLFPPVSLGAPGAEGPECFLNGPSAILCIRDDGPTSHAWVVNADSGRVAFDGPTDLSLRLGRKQVTQAGIYAVVEESGRGVSGVGPRAELTWLVPGNGKVDGHGQTDLGAKSLATQLVGGPGSRTKVVFAVADGRVVSPPTEIGRRQLNAVVYPNGFAIEEGANMGPVTNPDEILFFDNEGRQTGRLESRDSLVSESPDIPMTQPTSGDATVYTLNGGALAHVPRIYDLRSAHLIGSRLFIAESDNSSFPQWAQIDLKTRQRGNTCDFNLKGVLASDGEVFVVKIDNPKADAVAKGVDPVTCETLWRLPSQPDSFAQVWRVDTTLVQLSDDGTELFSLVAPS